MAKKIVRYLLEGNGTVPLFIENGGYYMVGPELVGLSVDEDERHVPATVHRLTRADLIARATDMGLKDMEGELLDEAGIAAHVQAFLDNVGLPDHA